MMMALSGSCCPLERVCLLALRGAELSCTFRCYHASSLVLIVLISLAVSPQMVLTIKLSSFAYNVWDGRQWERIEKDTGDKKKDRFVIDRALVWWRSGSIMV